MTNYILNPDLTIKNQCAISAKQAANPECGLRPWYEPDKGDIFITNAPEPPEGMIKPRFIDPDNWQQIVADAKAQEIEPVLWEEAAPQAELDAIALEKAKQTLTRIADEYVNSVAREYRYKDIHAVGIYQGEGNHFKAEADALGLFAGMVWAHMEQIEQDVIGGNRTIPAEAELLAELPIYQGP